MRSLAIDSSLWVIAGPPLAMLTVPNSASYPLDIGTTEARTLYAVGSTTAQSSARTIASIGTTYNYTNAMAGAQIFRTAGAGTGGLEHRAQCIGGKVASQSIKIGWPWNTPLTTCRW